MNDYKTHWDNLRIYIKNESLNNYSFYLAIYEDIERVMHTLETGGESREGMNVDDDPEPFGETPQFKVIK